MSGVRVRRLPAGSLTRLRLPRLVRWRRGPAKRHNACWIICAGYHFGPVLVSGGAPGVQGRGRLQVQFPIAPFARHCLLNGIDEMGFLLDAAAEVETYERRHLATIDTRR